jgi:hypothetical protein
MSHCFMPLTYDSNEVHYQNPPASGKVLRMLGFLPERDPVEAQVHLEMPYSDGVDHQDLQ